MKAIFDIQHSMRLREQASSQSRRAGPAAFRSPLKACHAFIVTENCHLLFHTASSHNSQGWARPKPGTQNSAKVFHTGGRVSRPLAVLCCFPGP